MQLTDRYTEAMGWAAELHADHLRKGSDVPYLSHLLAVSSLVMEHGGDEDQAIAALLHDAIEDTPVNRANIAARFGDRVADIVQDCTDAEVIPKPPWRPRKEAYIAHLPTVSPDTLLVSLADKTHNARSTATDVERLGEQFMADTFTGGIAGTRWYYRRLADVYESRIDELPDPAGPAGRSSGAPSLLAEYLTAIGRVGCTPEAADAYDRS